MGVALAASMGIFGQTKKPYQASAPSSVSYSVKDGEQNVEITNVAYELVGSAIPGRPLDERLVLRKTTKTRQVIDEIGMEASTTIEAWPLGVDLKQKPLYSFTAEGIDPATRNSEVIVLSRGLEEVEWWTVYKLGSGQRLFDTYAPLIDFSISRDTVTTRYVGLEVPEDDAKDARLRAANVVGVVTYASAAKVIREALITCDDPKKAALLRSFADASRTLTYSGGALRLAISQNYPSAPATVTIAVPVAKDDLDLAKAVLPAGVRVAAFKR